MPYVPPAPHPAHGRDRASGEKKGSSATWQSTTGAPPGEQSHRWPEILPGQRAVLFTVGMGGTFDEARIELLRLDTGERKVLIEKGTNPKYVPTGHLVFARGGALLAVQFDLDRLEVNGSPVPVLEGVRTEITGAAHFAFSRSGHLVYLPGPAQATKRYEMVWVKRDGTASPVMKTAGAFSAVRLSGDGQRLAVTVSGAHQDLWILEFARGILTRFTFEGSEEFDSVWTPDAQRIAYSSEHTENSTGLTLFWKKTDGTGRPEILWTGKHPVFPQSWSPDGRLLAVTEFTETGWDISVLPRDGQRRAQPFVRTPFAEAEPAFSPDGRWIAYTSNESGKYEIYVQPYPGPGTKTQISTDGGMEPAWGPQSREIFYRSGERMMAVPIRLEPGFSAGAPSVLFTGPYVFDPDPEFRQYDVAPDGKRFVMLREVAEEATSSKLTVVVDWLADFTRRVPPGKIP